MSDKEVTESAVRFESRLFTAVEGAYFRKSAQTQDPVLIVALGEEEAALPIAGIRRELKMAEGSPDDIMLQRVVAGFDFVKILRPGGTLPKEILTGEASWAVTDTRR